jgi:hypothetical protein
LTAKIIPPPGEWHTYRIYRGKLYCVGLNGRLKYFDLDEEIAVEMPTWLERALREGASGDWARLRV